MKSEDFGVRRRQEGRVPLEDLGREGEIRIGDVMITRMVTVEPEQRIALARLRMLRHGVGALPVIGKDRTLLGILTLRDIDLAGQEASSLQVKELMTTEIITKMRNSLLSEAVDVMLETGIQRIPIVDEAGRLIGLVTQTTVIKSTRHLLR